MIKRPAIKFIRRRAANKHVTAAAYVKRYREWSSTNCSSCLKYQYSARDKVYGTASSCLCCGTPHYTCFDCMLGPVQGDNTLCGECRDIHD